MAVRRKILARQARHKVSRKRDPEGRIRDPEGRKPETGRKQRI